jgi:hypothetical protein
VSFILTAIGLILLLASLAAVAFGVFMAMDPKNRETGRFFAVWWVPAAAASSGVLMRDVVTFFVGILCFLVAGAAFGLRGTARGKPKARRTRDVRRRGTSGKSKGEDKAAS